MTAEDRNTLGFFTWFDLWLFLEQHGKADDQIVKLALPVPPTIVDMDTQVVNAEVVFVPTQQVKAYAFKEVYEALPGPETVKMLIEIAEGLTSDRWPDAGIIVTFLTNLKTRHA